MKKLIFIIIIASIVLVGCNLEKESDLTGISPSQIKKMASEMNLVWVEPEGGCQNHPDYTPCLRGYYEKGSVEDLYFNEWDCDSYRSLPTQLIIIQNNKCDELRKELYKNFYENN